MYVRIKHHSWRTVVADECEVGSASLWVDVHVEANDALRAKHGKHVLCEDASLHDWQVLQLVAVEKLAMKRDGHVSRARAVDGAQYKLWDAMSDVLHVR